MPLITKLELKGHQIGDIVKILIDNDSPKANSIKNLPEKVKIEIVKEEIKPVVATKTVTFSDQEMGKTTTGTTGTTTCTSSGEDMEVTPSKSIKGLTRLASISYSQCRYNDQAFYINYDDDAEKFIKLTELINNHSEKFQKAQISELTQNETYMLFVGQYEEWNRVTFLEDDPEKGFSYAIISVLDYGTQMSIHKSKLFLCPDNIKGACEALAIPIVLNGLEKPWPRDTGVEILVESKVPRMIEFLTAIDQKSFPFTFVSDELIDDYYHVAESEELRKIAMKFC